MLFGCCKCVNKDVDTYLELFTMLSKIIGCNFRKKYFSKIQTTGMLYYSLDNQRRNLNVSLLKFIKKNGNYNSIYIVIIVNTTQN